MCIRDRVLVVGGAAIHWHLGPGKVNDTVQDWRHWLDTKGILPLPHPSWRNTAWLNRNPWFETELLPFLKSEISDLLGPQARNGSA